MKKRDTYKSYLFKTILGIDKTYYKPNPKYSRSKDAPMHIALIIDGVVEDIMHCDKRLATLLLSNPLVVDIGENYYKINISDEYDENSETFRKSEDYE